MKIAIWLGITKSSAQGGAFSYGDRFIKLVDEYKFPENIEVEFLCVKNLGLNLSKPICELSQLPSFIYKLFRNTSFVSKYLIRFDTLLVKIRGLHGILSPKGVKMVYYPLQGYCLDSKFPFIATNWDIGHLSTHAFPELIWDGTPFEYRQNFYQNILPKALLTVCESEAGKKEVLKYTNVGEHKIRIMPIFAGEVTTLNVNEDIADRILSENNLNKYKYFFYPAQFWAHKNHYNLIKAFSAFAKENPDFKLVLSGSDKGTKNYIKQLVEDYGLTRQVVFLGFVPIETIYSMYKYATALVMASHFGPSNMPPIEAIEIGCPVLCSDLGGHREICGDAAIYFNSFDSNSISTAMKIVAGNRNFWLERIDKQKFITKFNTNTALKCLVGILNEAIELRSNWS